MACHERRVTRGMSRGVSQEACHKRHVTRGITEEVWHTSVMGGALTCTHLYPVAVNVI